MPDQDDITYLPDEWKIMPLVAYGKKPMVKNWTKLTADQLRKEFDNYESFNIGLVMGDPFFCIDCDVTSNELSQAMKLYGEWKRRLDDEGIIYADQKTRSGGHHLVFRFSQKVAHIPSATSVNKIDKMDIRSTDHQIVIAPSYVSKDEKKSGGFYKWRKGYELDAIWEHLDEVPDWILDIIDATRKDSAKVEKKIDNTRSNNIKGISKGSKRRIGEKWDSEHFDQILKLLHRDRCDVRDLWIKVIFACSNASKKDEDVRRILEVWSSESPKWDKDAGKQLITAWVGADEGSGKNKRYICGQEELIDWAKSDNPEGFAIFAGQFTPTDDLKEPDVKRRLFSEKYTLQDLVFEYQDKNNVDEKELKMSLMKCCRKVVHEMTSIIVAKIENGEGEFEMDYVDSKVFERDFDKKFYTYNEFYLEEVMIKEGKDKGQMKLVTKVNKRWLFEPLFADRDFLCRGINRIPFNPDEEDPVREGVLNLFSGYNVDPISRDEFQKNDGMRKIGKILELIILMEGSDKNAKDFILNWVCHLLQYPRDKELRGVPILMGPEGCGKTFFWEHFLVPLVLGTKNAFFAEDIDQFVGKKFNSHIFENILVVLPEIKGVEKVNQKIETLKGMVTAKLAMAEAKGKTPYKTRNNISFVFNTNHETPFKWDGERGRRWGFIQSSVDRLDDGIYWTAMKKEMTLENARYFLRFALDRDISNFNPSLPPMTEIRERASLGRDGPVEIFRERFLSGDVNFLGKVKKMENGDFYSTKEDIYHLFTQYCDRKGIKERTDLGYFWTKMMDWGGSFVAKQIPIGGGGRKRVIIINFQHEMSMEEDRDEESIKY